MKRLIESIKSDPARMCREAGMLSCAEQAIVNIWEEEEEEEDSFFQKQTG